MKKKTKAKRVVVTGKSDAANVQLRDYFAAMALCGIMAKPDEDTNTSMHYATFAYHIADAMLSAREAKP